MASVRILAAIFLVIGSAGHSFAAAAPDKLVGIHSSRVMSQSFPWVAQEAGLFKKHNLDFIFLITPETSEERVKKLDSLSSGFLYAVSSSSTTGKEKDFSVTEKYLQRLQGMNLTNPVLVGFGIKDKQTFETACKYANGAIIGTAYIKALEHEADVQEATKQFLGKIIK